MLFQVLHYGKEDVDLINNNNMNNNSNNNMNNNEIPHLQINSYNNSNNSNNNNNNTNYNNNNNNFNLNQSGFNFNKNSIPSSPESYDEYNNSSSSNNGNDLSSSPHYSSPSPSNLYSPYNLNHKNIKINKKGSSSPNLLNSTLVSTSLISSAYNGNNNNNNNNGNNNNYTYNNNNNNNNNSFYQQQQQQNYQQPQQQQLININLNNYFNGIAVKDDMDVLKESWKRIKDFGNDLAKLSKSATKSDLQSVDLIPELRNKLDELNSFYSLIYEKGEILKNDEKQQKKRLESDKNAEKREKRREASRLLNNVCRNCKTTETPEWRKGPDGTKSLCNACGLHYAKNVKKEAGNLHHLNEHNKKVDLHSILN